LIPPFFATDFNFLITASRPYG